MPFPKLQELKVPFWFNGPILLQKNRRRRNRKKKSKKKRAQEKKEQAEQQQQQQPKKKKDVGDKEKDKDKDKGKEPEVEIEYVTEEPEIYDPNFIFFKRIFEAFKVTSVFLFFLFKYLCILAFHFQWHQSSSSSWLMIWRKRRTRSQRRLRNRRCWEFCGKKDLNWREKTAMTVMTTYKYFVFVII